MKKIKLYVRTDDYSGTRYYRNFTVEENEYKVGDFYNHEEIKAIEQVTPDSGNDIESTNYNYYKLTTTFNGDFDPDNGDICEYYIAIWTD